MTAAPQTIASLLAHQAGVHKDAPAYFDLDGNAHSYRELWSKVQDIAAQLGRLARPKGPLPRIAMVFPNGDEVALALLSVATIGTALPFNPGYTFAEFEAYFQETTVDALLVPMAGQETAIEAAGVLGIPVFKLEGQTVHGTAPADKTSALTAPGPDDAALVLLTSGSTGRAKAVPLSNRNVCVSAGDVCRSMGLTADDRCLTMWEQYHVGGLVDLLLAPLSSGGSIQFTRGFNVSGFFEMLERYRPTWFQAVPTAYREMVNHAQRNAINVDGHSLKLLRSVAAPLPPVLMKELEDVFHVPVIQTFGMTEAGPLVTSTGLTPDLRKPGSVGRSCGTEVQVFSPEGEALPTGETGELAIRGANVFSGYENDPEANAKQFRNGWFFTGDIGHFDADHDLFLTGRLKQLINRGGEKINPQELDDALLEHPDIAEAACFATVHATLGEDVAAAVVLRDGAQGNEADIRQHLKDRLAAFKLPRRLVFLDQMPRNPVGKIDRLALSKTAEPAPAPAKDGSDEGLSDLQKRVAAVWAQELGVPSVQLDDDFFDLGGDSLSAVRLFLAVEAQFGSQLPKSILEETNTVREMADRIAELGVSDTASAETEEDEVGRSISAVMALGDIPIAFPGSVMKVANPDGGGQPLFWCFNSPAKEMPNLAKAVPSSMPLYGLFSGGRLFDNEEATLQGLAERYLDDIRKIQPTGPYRLAGNCKGAWIAARMALILEKQGETVEALVLLEHSEPLLKQVQGRMMMLFGAMSKRRAHRNIQWGKSGWSDGFANHPTMGFLKGEHGDFFQPDNIGELVGFMQNFMDAKPADPKRILGDTPNFVLKLHTIPGAFAVYRTGYRLLSGKRFRKKVRRNPFTGEPWKN